MHTPAPFLRLSVPRLLGVSALAWLATACDPNWGRMEGDDGVLHFGYDDPTSWGSTELDESGEERLRALAVGTQMTLVPFGYDPEAEGYRPVNVEAVSSEAPDNISAEVIATEAGSAARLEALRAGGARITVDTDRGRDAVFVPSVDAPLVFGPPAYPSDLDGEAEPWPMVAVAGLTTRKDYLFPDATGSVVEGFSWNGEPHAVPAARFAVWAPEAPGVYELGHPLAPSPTSVTVIHPVEVRTPRLAPVSWGNLIWADDGTVGGPMRQGEIRVFVALAEHQGQTVAMAVSPEHFRVDPPTGCALTWEDESILGLSAPPELWIRLLEPGPCVVSLDLGSARLEHTFHVRRVLGSGI